MTTTVIIRAYPAPPNQSVLVTKHMPDATAPGAKERFYLLAHSSELTLHICDGESVSVEESTTTVIPRPVGAG